MNSSIRRWLLAVVLVLLVGTPGKTQAGIVTFDANVNEWSSSTVANSGAGIYPIGGTGQVNGGFVVDTASTGAQIGLRAELRFGGPVFPQINNGVNKATYFPPAGPGTPATLALWNFDIDIDLRSAGLTINNYTAVLTITDGATVTPINLVTSGLVPSNAALFQTSENPGFAFLSVEFPAFNPNSPGSYSFDLTLTPTSDGEGGVLEVKMDVDPVSTPEPSTLALASVSIAGLGLRTWRKRGKRVEA